MNIVALRLVFLTSMALCCACAQDPECEIDRDCEPGFMCVSGHCELYGQSDGEPSSEDGFDGLADGDSDASDNDLIDGGDLDLVDGGDHNSIDAGDSDPVDGGDSDPVDGGDDEPVDGGDHDPGECLDPDGDGYGVGQACLGLDCAAEDASRHPGAAELCNGLDDDCDGSIDEDGVCPQANPNLWVFVLAGQSNMVGLGINAELGAADASPVPAAHVYCDHTVHPNANCLQWRQLGPGFGVYEDRFGPELSFGRRLHEYWPNRSIAILKVAEGASALADRWDARSGDLYQLLVQQVTSQMNDLHIAWSPQIAGFVWMHGESDACLTSQANAYYFNLRDLIEALRADLGLDLLPITAGLIADQPMWPEADKVRNATSLLADHLGPMDVVETTDLPRHADDLAHYNTVGLLELGRRFAESVQVGWAKMIWAFPADFSSAQGDGFWRYGACAASSTWLSWDIFQGRFESADESVLIGEGWVQPGGQQQAELSWWAPAAGRIEITATASLANAGGDGTRVHVARDERVLFGPVQVTSLVDAELHLVLDVQQGHQLRFITDSGPAWDVLADTTDWQISIQMLQLAGD